ncbi:MAG: hypothetical protein LAQ69_20810 [Acidobacteriia bacterium]|nr:hypothetical protein [Terriglobia bacterium]
MPFDPTAYGGEVSEILALDGGGERLMPLAVGRCSSERALKQLKIATATRLFPGSRAPEAAISGLYLYFSCLDEAHEIAQNISSAEGSYWHAIVHRQEPDAGNSRYWFRNVGAHPVFPALRQAAVEIGVDFGPRWDPSAFIDLCERVRREPGSLEEKRALEVQRAEWQLLFDYCAAKRIA